jgi:hypothetical protein
LHAAAFADKVSHGGLLVPSRERHIRPLLERLENDDDRIAVWRDLLATTKGAKIKAIAPTCTPASLGGCGIELDRVTALLRKSEDHKALDMWLTAIRAKAANEKAEQAPDLKGQGQHGKPRDKKDVTRFQDDATYAHARLRRDRPELHARVLAGERCRRRLEKSLFLSFRNVTVLGNWVAAFPGFGG